MVRSREVPIGVLLSQAARAAERAFEQSLADAGGSRATWSILLALKTAESAPPPSQAELADAVGIRPATLTHHLNGMEAAGLVTRARRSDNRRTHVVELTAAGNELFATLAGAARAHDRRLRAGFAADELAAVRGGLARLRANSDQSTS